MNQPLDHFDQFNLLLQASLRQAAQDCRAIALKKHAHVYTCGDQAKTVYFIESGQIKLVMLTPDGRECLLSILTNGDIFGELCLSGLSERQETATAMVASVVWAMPCAQFLLLLSCDELLPDFIQYLTARIADQQQVIANLITVDSKQRLFCIR